MIRTKLNPGIVVSAFFWLVFSPATGSPAQSPGRPRDETQRVESGAGVDGPTACHCWPSAASNGH